MFRVRFIQAEGREKTGRCPRFAFGLGITPTQTFQPNDLIVTASSAEGQSGGFIKTRLMQKSLPFHRWTANHGNVKRREVAVELMDNLRSFEKEFGGHR